MRILVACEESGAVTMAFRERGHEAYSCDILPTSHPKNKWHIQGDVLPLLKENWDMIIAFPPCTYLSKAGSNLLYPQPGVLNLERYKKGLSAKEFFMQILNAKCERIAVENPMPNRCFKLPKPSQWIQPYFFGEQYRKFTYLWLKGLPNLNPTKKVTPTKNYIRCVKGSFKRSKTFQGIAVAMAEQWGDLPKDYCRNLFEYYILSCGVKANE